MAKIKTKASPEFEPLSIAGQKLRAINHPLRQAMIEYMREQGKVNVTSIYKKLKTEQSIASQHLSILRKNNFVTTERDGKQILYSVNEEALSEFLLVAKQL